MVCPLPLMVKHGEGSNSMRVCLIGCEYAGKTSLAGQVSEWMHQTMGTPADAPGANWHDHFTYPYVGQARSLEETEAESATMARLIEEMPSLVE